MSAVRMVLVHIVSRNERSTNYIPSDIVAELACVHSGILGYEELMPYPNTAASVEHDQMTQQVAWSYDAQLWLRKHLNDIHAHYNPSDTYCES